MSVKGEIVDPPAREIELLRQLASGLEGGTLQMITTKHRAETGDRFRPGQAEIETHPTGEYVLTICYVDPEQKQRYLRWVRP